MPSLSPGETCLACPQSAGMPAHSKCLWSLGVVTYLAFASSSSAENPVSFSQEIAPIFQRHCVACHKEGKAKGKYRLDTYAAAMKELVAGKLEESELFYRITTDDEDDRMPAEADPLTRAEIALIERWIKEGAKYDAEDPGALLSTIVPMEEHPAPPESYPRPLPVTAMVFAKEGQELVTGGYHELLVWDPQDGRLLRRISNNGQRTYELVVSPDGKLIAAATGAPGQAGEVRIFEAESGSVVAAPFRGDDIAQCVAFDPQGGRIACGGADGKLRVFETGTWQEQLVLTAHSDWINALAWDVEGKRIATGSRDQSAKVFDLSVSEGGRRLITFSGHSQPVRGVAFHPNNEEVLSCGDQGLVLRWKISDGKKSGDLANLGGPALRLVEGEAGYFASGPDGLAVQFQTADQKRLRDFRVETAEGSPPARIGACAVFGPRLALGTFGGRVVFFDLESGKESGGFLAVPTVGVPATSGEKEGSARSGLAADAGREGELP